MWNAQVLLCCCIACVHCVNVYIQSRYVACVNVYTSVFVCAFVFICVGVLCICVPCVHYTCQCVHVCACRWARHGTSFVCLCEHVCAWICLCVSMCFSYYMYACLHHVYVTLEAVVCACMSVVPSHIQWELVLVPVLSMWTQFSSRSP